MEWPDFESQLFLAFEFKWLKWGNISDLFFILLVVLKFSMDDMLRMQK